MITPIITCVRYYKINGTWYYSAWTRDGHDHNGECEDCESVEDAKQWLSTHFPVASINAV